MQNQIIATKSTLNLAQGEAVAALDGPVLVLSGAGTGKTRVLTARLAALIGQKKAFASQILAVTFTNKAAREMRERVATQIGSEAQSLRLGTFHSVAARMLRQHAEMVGLTPDFTILDADDQLRLIKELLQAANIDDKKCPPRIVLAQISRWKDQALTPEKVKKSWGDPAQGGDYGFGGSYPGYLGAEKMVEIYADYQQRLKTVNAADFGDLLLHIVTLLKQQPEVLQHYQDRLRYLLVDEYQDTNAVQYMWLRLLAAQSRNLCCVGDDDQSIYGWRGAEIGNILNFERDYPDARIIRLEQNYRSTPEILAAASSLIAHNSTRLPKTLWTDAAAGEKIRVCTSWDGRGEARWIGDTIEQFMRMGKKLGQMAILVRTGSQTRPFEEMLTQRGLPYVVFGGLRFYERAEIRDAVAYLRLIRQAGDELAFDRIINEPKRGIGDRALAVIHETARAQNLNLIEASRQLVEHNGIKGTARAGLAEFLRYYEIWRLAAAQKKLDQLTAQVLDESGYTARWHNDKAPDAYARLENLRELQQSMREFESLTDFLDHVALVTELYQDTATEKISIMTLHLAKGLEFDQVFLPGWEEKLFPHSRALDESGQRGLEEERRLAYVGLTRARQQALISNVANRLTYDKWEIREPSRFLREIDPKCLIIEREPGLPGFDGEATGGQYAGEAAGQYPGTSPGRSLPIMTAGEGMSNSLSNPLGPIIDVPPSQARPHFAAGDRVRHDHFGIGRVISVLGSGSAIGLEIEFDQAGRKKIMARFVRPV
ncbi:MAG: UvrD-helicase domain-containing protein [Candidatus Symbiobacter sp.]|nr:UvrD-helicase domain-containing protein [Candidatus Symbiobacter sp.]